MTSPWALAQRGRLEEATAHFQAALKIKPDYAQGQDNFGIALAGADGLRKRSPITTSSGNQARLRRSD